MSANSKRFLAFLVIALTAMWFLSFLNYWLDTRTIDGLFGRELSVNNALDMSLSAIAARDQALIELKRWLFFDLLLSAAIGLACAVILNRAWRQRTRSLERVTEGAMAIARGKFDQSLTTSSDDTRLFVDSVNLLSARLREQLEREAESRQFASFMRFAATLTHDLKNAIGGLSLLVKNMEKHYEREDFRADTMQSLKEETEKLQSLVDRLGNPVDTLSGEHKLPQPTDLVPLIRRTLKSVTGPAPQPHRIQLELPDTLVAVVDAERIGRVIENLVLNAFQAMQPEAGTLTIAAGVEGDDKIFIKVADTGRGMTAEFLKSRLFHPFATTKSTGLGLGLYTCREVIRAHGGTIDVRSQSNAGATFKVVLPCAPTRADAS
jgi:signal transduction histidine kinase